MPLFHFVFWALVASSLPLAAGAQSSDGTPPRLSLELNAVKDVEGACRMTFVTQNDTGIMIERAVFEAVIFDTSEKVVSLSLFDFRDLPADKPRVRQFDVADMACEDIRQALINGVSSCVVDAVESNVCENALSLDSRISVELLG